MNKFQEHGFVHAKRRLQVSNVEDCLKQGCEKRNYTLWLSTINLRYKYGQLQLDAKRVKCV